MHVCMYIEALEMTKVISLSDEAYADLKNMKKSGESFSDVVLRMSKTEKRPLSDFFGKWPGTKEEISSIEKEISETRKKSRLRY